MKIPFTTNEFLQVFERYNENIWPLQVMFYALAVYACMSIVRKASHTSSIVFAVLAFFWIWMGVVYHLLFFSQINKAANIFGILFIAQGLMFLYHGTYRQSIKLKAARDVSGVLGFVLVLYALIGYPLFGMLTGHVYPAAPTFGVPCPTTIFTFGVLLFAQERIQWYVVIIPFLWSLLGFSAAINLSVPQDYGLVIAGVVSTIIVVFAKPKETVHADLAV
ncbi:MAG TPA: DUF6064 family protein [Chryseosolibacter sp.]|nr:DUF6064 family protein [Chryseosolibacter sp.]